MGEETTGAAAAAWETAQRELSGLPGGRGLNIAHEAVDRHAAGRGGARDALRFVGRDGRVRAYTYAALAAASNRFAGALTRLGVRAGDSVFALCGRTPALYVGALGTLKARGVFTPLFAAFGPEPIATRMERGNARVLLTTAALYERKVAPIRHRLPSLAHVIVAGSPLSGPVAGAHHLDALLADSPPTFEIPPTSPETLALVHFTSGTTGVPKGVMHVHEAVRMHHATGRIALGLGPEDVFWCTADPGWVTGTSYGIIAPLTCGVTSVVDEAEFDAARWYGILQDQRVTVWYTAPTAIRMLMRLGDQLPRRYDLGRLRFAASVGEPLNPEAVLWGERVLGQPIHDNWWQTETGGIAIGNIPGMQVKPGSMGKPLPGITAGIVQRRDAGGSPSSGPSGIIEVREPDVVGELALRPPWPSMFRGYLHEEERYARCFADGWYLTGDLARRDRDGYYWFVGRADDLIKSAGHLISPFEVESALLSHPAVAEAGVIGVPHPVSGAMVKAFVALRPGHEPGEALSLELLGHARQKLGAAVAPRELVFVDQLPRTRSGKIMRRLLRARELGLPEGDTSTLESDRDPG
jgi:acetyl-CoA synthetase